MFTRYLIRCRQNCNSRILKEPQISITFNEQHATGSTSISYKPSISAKFNRLLHLVRDQGVGGSNPLSPTNIFNNLNDTSGFIATSM